MAGWRWPRGRAVRDVLTGAAILQGASDFSARWRDVAQSSLMSIVPRHFMGARNPPSPLSPDPAADDEFFAWLACARFSIATGFFCLRDVCRRNASASRAPPPALGLFSRPAH